MSNSSLPSLGPSVFASLVTRELDRAVRAYGKCLQLRPGASDIGDVSETLAALWGCPGLAGARYCILNNALGEPCLRLVEDKEAETLKPLRYHGWMALEIVVEDVDALAGAIEREGAASGFEVLRPAADLELSNKIRASQIAGPCGEVLYLTRIDGKVPPFDLPKARCPVDRLFIPVLSVPVRQDALSFYRQFPGTRALEFDTRITVVNQTFGLPLEHQHPVATVALHGKSLIEIDQLDLARAKKLSPAKLPPGIATVSFEVDSFAGLAAAGIAWAQAPREIPDAPYAGRSVALVRGSAGELLELVERSPGC